MGQYQHRTYRTIAMVRAGLVSIIYRKTATVSLRNVDPAASMTLMSADMERIVQGWQTMHEIWSNLIEVAVAIYLLERQLGVACVVPVAVSIGGFFSPPSVVVHDRAGVLTTEKRFAAGLHDRHELHHVAAGHVARGH